MNPIDLLPVDIPYLNTNEYDDIFFYNNVIKEVLPDVIKMEATGIPIDLNKVKELEEKTTTVLDDIDNKIKNSRIINDFLNSKNIDIKVNKTKEDFIKEYNNENIILRSYVINRFLDEHNLDKDKLDKWKKKDISMYAAIKGFKFLNDIANNNISHSTMEYINRYLDELAEEKYTIYVNNLRNKVKDVNKFNYASKKQLAELFDWLGIKSEKKTKKGSPSWDRDQLELLAKKLKYESEVDNE